MNIPTEQDIYKIAMTNPTVHAVLTLYRQGRIASFDDAMRICVAALVEVVGVQHEKLVELISSMPPQSNNGLQPTSGLSQIRAAEPQTLGRARGKHG